MSYMPGECYSGPLAVDFDVTTACNQRCLHCNVNAGRRLDNELSTDEVKRILYEAWELGVANIAITGGEPLTRTDWKEIVSYACNLKGWTVEINTNGTLWQDDDIAFVSTKCPSLNIVMSLDGHSPETYGILRRRADSANDEDNFYSVVRTSRKMAEMGLSRVTINYTITKPTMKHFFKTADLAEKLGANRFLGIKFFPYGRGQTYISELDVPYGLWKDFILEIYNAKSRGKYRLVSISPLCPWEVYLPLTEEGIALKEIHSIMGYSTPRVVGSFRNATSLGCQAGITSCAVFPDGEVYPCGTIVGAGYAGLACGNLRHQGLSDIWLNSSTLRRMRRVTLEMIGEPCAKCQIASLCGGGCRGRAYKSTGMYSGQDRWCPRVERYHAVSNLRKETCSDKT